MTSKKIYTCCNKYASQGHTVTCSNHKYKKDLKPCPFCQSQAEILPQAPRVPGMKCWIVRCTHCQCRMEVFSNLLVQVRAEWNYRKEQPKKDDNHVIDQTARNKNSG